MTNIEGYQTTVDDKLTPKLLGRTATVEIITTKMKDGELLDTHSVETHVGRIVYYTQRSDSIFTIIFEGGAKVDMFAKTRQVTLKITTHHDTIGRYL